MAYLHIEDLSFSYADAEGEWHGALRDITFDVERGSIAVVCGPSASGKTTLLRMLKTALSPAGERKGQVLLDGKPLQAIPAREQARRIGFVMQDPAAQLCSDTVLGELAFGLENIGCDRQAMRESIAEVALFFGLQDLLGIRTLDLSGGEKQLVNLASVVASRPDLLVLDEPTAQLDPIMRTRFLHMIERLNAELGITIVMSEHQLDDCLAIARKVVVLDGGACTCIGTPTEVVRALGRQGSDEARLLPAPTRIFLAVEGVPEDGTSIPLTVREGRRWLEEAVGRKDVPDAADAAPCAGAAKRFDPTETNGEHGAADAALSIKDVRFRYERDGADILKDCSLDLRAGAITALLGSNGSGKSTLLKVACGALSPILGSVRLHGRPMRAKKLLTSAHVAYLPQDVTLLFTGETVEEELDGASILGAFAAGALDGFGSIDPFDLSVGQQQLLGLAKVLGTGADIVLLDEPTKGMDLRLRAQVQTMLTEEAAGGRTLLIATHDIDLAAACAHSCAMMLDGSIAVCAPTEEVLERNFLYTTAARRMSAGIVERGITPEEVVAWCRSNARTIA